MIQKSFKKISPSDALLIAAITALLVVATIFLVHNFRAAKHGGAFDRHNPVSDLLMKNKQAKTTSAADATYIDVWMNFAYVNFIFDLPPNFLRDSLHIDDAKYPDLPIGRYIKTKNLNKDEFLDLLRKTVGAYISAHPVK